MVIAEGFQVEDANTGHTLMVRYENEVYQGMVLMPDQDVQLPLKKWAKGENPFDDDYCFKGVQSGYAPDGAWWFCIEPSSPFSEIMAEVEGFNENKDLGSVFKPKRDTSHKLSDIVDKSNNTGYLFIDIMNDIGESVEDIMEASKLIQMTYAYARRSAATALYLQCIIDQDMFDHNMSFFKAVQVKTEHSADFQEQSFSDAIEFMQSYSPIITRLLIKNMALIELESEVPSVKLSDSELIQSVMDSYTSLPF